ncbi:hypothetical protein BZL30_3865 [Mycobacterium kansasii]|uniref:Uncharacterized protein n=1 Tax=Mycobacterium kansasii TaxID=1768 RepID=A0A1V3X9T2_MYCKA|nr:hypothetical protein BZL30_3865 [Mycobacterium kansasii]
MGESGRTTSDGSSPQCRQVAEPDDGGASPDGAPNFARDAAGLSIDTSRERQVIHSSTRTGPIEAASGWTAGCG